MRMLESPIDAKNYWFPPLIIIYYYYFSVLCSPFPVFLKIRFHAGRRLEGTIADVPRGSKDSLFE